MKKLLALLTVVTVLAGCNKSHSAIYTGTECGFIDNGVFTSDYQVKMTVVGNERKYDVTAPRRVLISYETQPATADASGYDIDLLGLMDAVIREPSSAEALDNQPAGAPVQVSNAWFSGGYLNLLVTVEGKADKAGDHQFSARYTADENGLVIRFLHESGETASLTADERISMFLSIPLSEAVLSWEHACLAVGKKAAYPVSVTLQWTDYVLEGGPLNLYEKQGSYTPAS